VGFVSFPKSESILHEAKSMCRSYERVIAIPKALHHGMHARIEDPNFGAEPDENSALNYSCMALSVEKFPGIARIDSPSMLMRLQ